MALARIPASAGYLDAHVELNEAGYLRGRLVSQYDPHAARFSLLLANGERVAALDTYTAPRLDAPRFLQFEAFTASYALPAGTYQIGFMVQSAGGSAIEQAMGTLIVPQDAPAPGAKGARVLTYASGK